MSEQEKVGGITFYERLSVFLELVACFDGLTRCLRSIFIVGSTAHIFG